MSTHILELMKPYLSEEDLKNINQSQIEEEIKFLKLCEEEEEKNNIKQIKELIQKGININIQDYNGDNALIKAARNYNTELVNLLLNNNIDINTKNLYNSTALSIASTKEYIDIIKLLLKIKIKTITENEKIYLVKSNDNKLKLLYNSLLESPLKNNIILINNPDDNTTIDKEILLYYKVLKYYNIKNIKDVIINYFFENRKNRNIHPYGTFDDKKRWYPSDEEEMKCCSGIRKPSVRYPYSLMVHCRTLQHIKNLVNYYIN